MKEEILVNDQSESNGNADDQINPKGRDLVL